MKAGNPVSALFSGGGENGRSEGSDQKGSVLSRQGVGRYVVKYLKLGPYEIAAFVILLFAVAIRVILVAQGWPVTNSDEATIGLMGLHILHHGELPIFFYGQNYMGALQAYLGAGFFALFGSSVL